MSFSQSFKDRGLISSSLRPGILPKKQQQPTKQKVRNDHGKISGLPSFKSFLQQSVFQEGTDSAYMLYYGEFYKFVSKQLAFRPNVKDPCMYQWLEEIRGNKPLSKENEKLYNQTLSKCRTENCGSPASIQECFDALLAFKKAVDNQKVKLPVISDKISNDKKLSDKKYKLKLNKNNSTLNLNKNNNTLNIVPIRQERKEEVDGGGRHMLKFSHGTYFDVNEEDIWQEKQQGGKKSRSVPQKNRNAFVVKRGEPGVLFIDSPDIDQQMKQTGAIFSSSDQRSLEKYDRRNIDKRSQNEFNNFFKKETIGVVYKDNDSSTYLFNGVCKQKKGGETLFKPRDWHSWPKKKLKKGNSQLPKIYNAINK